MSTNIEQELIRIESKYSRLGNFADYEEILKYKAPFIELEKENCATIYKHRSKPSSIHHYCTLDTGINILKHQELWLSSIEKMSDTSEMNCFMEAVHEKINEHVKDHPGKGVLGEDAKFLCTNFWHARPLAFVFKKFAFCFSEKKDLLSQWRAYGDKGRGISISFATKKIVNYTIKRLKFNNEVANETVCEIHIREEVRNNLFLIPSVYDEGIKNIIISSFVNATFNKEDALYISQLLHSFTGGLKHDAFKEENEWRLLFVSSFFDGNRDKIYNLIDYRDGARGLTPFVRLIFENGNSGESAFPVEHITLGPQNDTSIEDMKNFLVSVGLKDVTVSRSTIPYKD